MDIRSSLDLPVEIVELIVDQAAAAGDKDTLRNLATASQRYTIRCQKHLFHTIDLGDRCIPGREYFHRFLYILSHRPHLGLHVRELRLVDTFVWDGDKADNWAWLLTEESLCDAFDLLPNLAAFSLTFNATQPSWPDFAPALRHALIQLAQRPKIQTFALSHIARFPPSLLVTLTAGVRRLDLSDLSLQELSAAAPLEVVLGVAAIATPKVETLSLRAPSAGMLLVLRTILSVAPLPTLTSLKVVMVDHNDTLGALELWGLMHWAANSITELEWRPAVRLRTPATCPPAPINLSILTRLSSLHFLVNFHTPSPVFASLLPLLHQISSGSYFHTLIIECVYIQHTELVACQRDWTELDEVLCTGSFDGLREVGFVVRRRSKPKMRHSKGDAGVVIGEMLPCARARGVKVWFDPDWH